ncbi:uncharacterized protein [Temnothorax nylanderi]|uniref:uncharacterized protein n=1 Tax=Temnothorax nylanderi TaxID=102681 RepID=UPI003A84DB96
MVYFRAGNEEQAAQRELNRDTTLTAWLKLNQSDENAVQFLYIDIPYHYVYDKKETKWKPRKKGGDKIISRLYTVSIKDIERFYLRLLLLHVAGAKCFKDLKTVNGVVYETFKDAAIAKNLVETDDLWGKTLEEAIESKMPVQLRELFSYICIFGTPIDVLAIWNKYKDFLIEDFVHKNVVNPENMALNHIQEILINNGSSCENFQLPNPTPVNIYITEYNVDEERIRGDYLLSTLNAEQKHVYDIVMRAIENQNELHRGNSQAARELIIAKLIIWDEVSMTVGHALTAVDKLLRDLMKNPRPFGGKVILFAGDFRQNLPVVPHAQKAAIIESTVKYSSIWRNVTQVKLKQNMRTGEEKEFANWLMQLGDVIESPWNRLKKIQIELFFVLRMRIHSKLMMKFFV